MTTTEAMKLALEALKRMKGYGNTFAYRSHEQNPHEQVCEAITALEALASEAIEQPAQQEEPVGALILGGVVDTSDGPEYEEWDIEWNHKAIESLQERLVTHNPVTLNIYASPPQRPSRSDIKLLPDFSPIFGDIKENT